MTLRRTMRPPWFAAALVCLGALAAGCTSSGSSSSSSSAAGTSAASAAATASPVSSPSSASPSSPATSASPSSSGGAGAGGSGSGSGGSGSGSGSGGSGSGTPGCATRDLQVTAGLAQGAAGSVYQVIDFTNIGTASCSLYGYPGIALAGGSPVDQIGAAASRSPQAAPALVTLHPGGVANTLLRITQAQNYPTSRCGPMASTYLQIYPPNQTTPIYLGYQSTGCSETSVNLLTVGVVQSGAGSGS